MADQVLLYNELGRHTPPPPPYSLSKRDLTKIPFANEVAPQPAPLPPPPPPPPYLTSTGKCDCTIPTIDNLRPQAIPRDHLSSCHRGNAALSPLVALERPARHNSSVPQSIEDFPRSWKNNWRYAGVPAHPIEPKWAPVGIPGYPGPSIRGGAPVPSPELALERLGRSTPRDFFFGADAMSRPDYGNRASASPSNVYMVHDCASCSAQPPFHAPTTVAIKDEKPIRAFRKQSGKEIASLANIIATNLPGPIEPSDRSRAVSASQHQQPSATPTTLVPVPKSESLHAPEEARDVKDPPRQTSDNGTLNDGSGSENELSAHAAAGTFKTRNPASPAAFLSYGAHRSAEDDLPKTSPGHDRGCDRAARSGGHRKPSFASRYEPYKRRRPDAAGFADRGGGGGVEEGCGMVVGMERRSDVDEDADGGEEVDVAGEGGRQGERYRTDRMMQDQFRKL